MSAFLHLALFIFTMKGRRLKENSVILVRLCFKEEKRILIRRVASNTFFEDLRLFFCSHPLGGDSFTSRLIHVCCFSSWIKVHAARFRSHHEPIGLATQRQKLSDKVAEKCENANYIFNMQIGVKPFPRTPFFPSFSTLCVVKRIT